MTGKDSIFQLASEKLGQPILFDHKNYSLISLNSTRAEKTAEFFDEEGFGFIGDVGHYDEVLVFSSVNRFCL